MYKIRMLIILLLLGSINAQEILSVVDTDNGKVYSIKCDNNEIVTIINVDSIFINENNTTNDSLDVAMEVSCNK